MQRVAIGIVAAIAVLLIAFLSLRRGSPPVSAPVPTEEDRTVAFSDIHTGWDQILAKTVNPAGWIDYEALRGTYAPKLERYLARLEVAELEGRSLTELQAFWLNAYNAICIRTVIDHGLPDSLRPTPLGNIFPEERYRVAGELRSLDEIEHEILRKKYPDPRLHAAIVCGASSCPRLRAEAFHADRLSDQLDEECRVWMQTGLDKKGRRKNRLDRENKTVYLSSILYWYSSDFGEKEQDLIDFFEKYASEDDRRYVSKNRVEVDYLDYDWSLNRQ